MLSVENVFAPLIGNMSLCRLYLYGKRYVCDENIEKLLRLLEENT